MEAFSLEKSILEGEKEIKELFAFIQQNAEGLEAYEAEVETFSRLMKIGQNAMKAEMQDDVYLHSGYPIGTGVVESSSGHVVQDRMEGTGCRWSVKGAEAILLLRSIYTSRDWDTYWEAHRSIEKRRLYGRTLDILASHNQQGNIAA